jgi:hypothetical protein
MTDDPNVVIEDDPLDLPMDFDVVEAKPKEEKPAKVETKAAAEKEEGVDNEAFESLKRQLAEAQAERDQASNRATEALRHAREAETKATQAVGHTLASQIDSVDSAIAVSKSEADQAQRAYAAAMEIADYDAAAKQQRIMSRAEAEIMRLQDGKAVLADRHKKVSEQPQRREVPSGVEGMLDGIIEASSAKAQTYIRKNRSSLSSEKHVNRMIAAHQLAVNSDVEPDTEAYFSFIDKQMGWGEKDPETPARKVQNKSFAAPTSRDSNPGVNNGRTVTLTKEQVAIAKEMGVSPTAYAKNMLKIKSNGKDPSADGLRFSSDIR